MAMRMAFASETAEDQVSGFSGIPYHMSQAIRADTESFQYIQTPPTDLEALLRGDTRVRHALEAGSKRLSEFLEKADVDAVICQGSSMIPWLETKKTVVLWHDATCFSLTRLSFDEFKARYPLLFEWDGLILAKCDLVVFAAEWLREETLRCYDVSPEKVHVIPFGANIQPPSEESVREAIEAREATPCRLTFLGVDWQRKGLPLAYEVLSRLKANGLRTELSVIGCEVEPISRRHRLRHLLTLQPFTDTERFQLRYCRNASINRIGFLRKDDRGQSDRLGAILQRTHFFLHPAEFEPFGIAPIEANAFGVPVLGTVGYGLSTTIRPGYNGQLYARGEYVERAVEFIQQQMRDRTSYEALAVSSYLEYKERLNWAVSWRKVAELVAARSTRQGMGAAEGRAGDRPC
jgi:glycosyltransferase involved in cell wall biosynthesis